VINFFSSSKNVFACARTHSQRCDGEWVRGQRERGAMLPVLAGFRELRQELRRPLKVQRTARGFLPSFLLKPCSAIEPCSCRRFRLMRARGVPCHRAHQSSLCTNACTPVLVHVATYLRAWPRSWRASRQRPPKRDTSAEQAIAPWGCCKFPVLARIPLCLYVSLRPELLGRMGRATLGHIALPGGSLSLRDKSCGRRGE
jgi:hypothetical protein